MLKILNIFLWGKFILVLILIGGVIFSDFLLLSSWASPEWVFLTLLWGKPLTVLVLVLLQNLLFSFHDKISIHNLIPSSFLLISIVLVVDLIFWGYSHFEILSPHKIFWGIYGFVIGVSLWNIQRYIRAFTTGI
jgi:hypothetical protein